MPQKDSDTLLICSECRWWRAAAPFRRGECRRRAPSVLLTSGADGQPLQRSVWPRTMAEDGCGDHEAGPRAFAPLVSEGGQTPGPIDRPKPAPVPVPVAAPVVPASLAAPLQAASARVASEARPPTADPTPEGPQRVGDRYQVGVRPSLTPERDGVTPRADATPSVPKLPPSPEPNLDASYVFLPYGGDGSGSGRNEPVLPPIPSVTRPLPKVHGATSMPTLTPPDKLPDTAIILGLLDEPSTEARRAAFPVGTATEKSGEEGWRMARRSFVLAPPLPIDRVDGGKGAYFTYGAPGRPVLTLPVDLVDDDANMALAWMHAELVRKAVQAGRSLSQSVRKEYPAFAAGSGTKSKA